MGFEQLYVTKWVESFPFDNQTSETLVRLLFEHVIRHHGVPEGLISDRRANLLSTLMAEVGEVMRMQKINSAAYHPQADGLVENLNRTLQARFLKVWIDLVWTGMSTYLTYSLPTGRSPTSLLGSLPLWERRSYSVGSCVVRESQTVQTIFYPISSCRGTSEWIALSPGLRGEGERRPGIDCMCMRQLFSRFWRIRLRTYTVSIYTTP